MGRVPTEGNEAEDAQKPAHSDITHPASTYLPAVRHQSAFGKLPILLGAPATLRCLVCLDDCNPKALSDALSCAHPVCSDCLAQTWTHNIITDSDPFPRCPIPGCLVYASDRAVARLVSLATTRRMRQLRSLKPVRSADGRRMFCITDGCCEQLPPPPPLHAPAVSSRPPPGEGSSAGSTTGDAGRTGAVDDVDTGPVENMVSACPECGQGACLRCGCAEHPGRACVTPLVCERQRKMYNDYAVGRVTACPRCGMHIERDGGCMSLTCPQCRRIFEFRPFRTAEEAEEAPAAGETQISENEERGPDCSLFSYIVMMPLYSGSSWIQAFALSGMTQSEWWIRSILFFPVPFYFIGFTWGFLGVFRNCWRAVHVVGQPETGRYSVAMFLVGVMIAWVVHFGLRLLLVGSPTWWVVFIGPYYVCAVFLATPAIAHVGVIMYMYLLERRRNNAESMSIREGGRAETELELLADEDANPAGNV